MRPTLKPHVFVARHVHGNGLDDRLDRLIFSTDEQRVMALAFLSGFAPEAFEAIMDAAEQGSGELEGTEVPEPRCARCNATIGIFLKHGLGWQHYRGDGVTIGKQEIFFPDHEPVPYAEPAACQATGADAYAGAGASQRRWRPAHDWVRRLGPVPRGLRLARR